jgi:glycosyltransferase involved in cell wall biosynthesis
MGQAAYSRAGPVIYVVDPSKDVTGAFVGACNIARALQGKASVVLVLPRGHRISSSRMGDFLRVRELRMVTRNTAFGIIVLVPSLLIGALRIWLWMRKDRASQVILNDIYLLHGAALRLMGFRGWIATWVRLDPRRLGRSRAKAFTAAMSFSADQVISVSQYVAQRLGPELRSVVIYDPVPEDTAEPATPASIDKDGASDACQFVMLGNYTEGKGHDAAVAAFAEVLPRIPGATLELFGSDMGLQKNRDYRARLEIQAREAGLAETKVRFFGPVRNFRDAFRDADVALNFSRSESFSMTCIEASFAGLPVIATRSGGPEEIIEDGKTGLLVAVDDLGAMGEAMVRLGSDRALARDMGQQGAELVRRRFSRSVFRERLMVLLGINSAVSA